MQIKRIEAVGFKSFCERAVVTIDDPITAIVGPNGCGKSNIVDAIRWCMGEQSAKHLRGQSMGDVIFGGSEQRKPSGMAEVSLVFENPGFSSEATVAELEIATNSEGKHASYSEEDLSGDLINGQSDTEPDPEGLPQEDSLENLLEDVEDYKPLDIDFSRYDEVIVTRRLFRDGTSGYFINKIPCRLRDVTDFFLGTGIGTKAYSIIEQGRIGMIVSSRPQERRLLIEEAAGITKFKVKKRAAERRLEQTRQNLARIKDITSELAKQLEQLRKQSEKAKLYREHRAELKDLELWAASHLYSDLDAVLSSFKKEYAIIAHERDTLRTNLDLRDAKLTSSRSELALEERRLTDLQEEVHGLTNRIGLLETKVSYETTESQNLTEQVALVEKERENLSLRQDEVEGKLSKLHKEIADIEAQVKACETTLSAKSNELQEQKKTSEFIYEKITQNKESVAQAEADIVRGEITKKTLAFRKTEVAQRKDRISAEYQKMLNAKKSIDTEFSEEKERVGGLRQVQLRLETKKEDWREKIEASSKRLIELEDQHATMRSQVEKSTARLHLLQELQEKHVGLGHGTQAILQRDDKSAQSLVGIGALFADIITVPKEFEVCVENALGSRLHGVCADSYETIAGALSFLKKNTAGTSVFIPLMDREREFSNDAGFLSMPGVKGALVDFVTCDKKYESVIAKLLAGYLVCETFEAALACHRNGYSGVLVTLDGDMIAQDGTVTGGYWSKQIAGVLTQKREIRELEEEVVSLTKSIASVDADLTETGETKQKLEAVLIQLTEDVRSRDFDILGLEKDVARKKSEVERVAEQIKQTERELANEEEAFARIADEEVATVATVSRAKEIIEEGEREKQKFC